jgi:tryptophan-rich sensory protein
MDPARSTGIVPAGWAVLLIAGVLAGSGLMSRPYTPDPSHPRIRRWYGRLDKPGWKPPDPLFGAIWPVLQALHSWGAWRLMRRPESPERDAALGLWVADMALVPAWAKIFFGRRSLTGGVAGAAVMALSAAAYVERAMRVDRTAAAAAIPFLLWCGFGGLMSESLRERNPRMDGARRH